MKRIAGDSGILLVDWLGSGSVDGAASAREPSERCIMVLPPVEILQITKTETV